MSEEDAFWDELGFPWRVSIQDPQLLAERVETHLRIQRVVRTGAAIAGAAVSLLGLALGSWTLWIGWTDRSWNFLTRGATLAAVSLLAATATAELRRRNPVETRSLRGMLQRLSTNTENLIRAADLACYSVAIVAIGGTIGYALRSHFGRPPSMPLTADLLAVIIVGLPLVWYRSAQARALRRYSYLSEVFRSGDMAPVRDD